MKSIVSALYRTLPKEKAQRLQTVVDRFKTIEYLYECSSSKKNKKRSNWFFKTIVNDDSGRLNVENKGKCRLRQCHEWLKVRFVKRKMSISHAHVYFRNETQNIVPLSATQNFSPKNEEDFNKTKKYKVWLKNGQDEKRMFL